MSVAPSERAINFCFLMRAGSLSVADQTGQPDESQFVGVELLSLRIVMVI